MICPSCQVENPDRAKFCFNCGTRLTPVAPTPVEERPCRSCGALLPPDARFCGECGTPDPIAADPPPTSAPAPAPQPSAPEPAPVVAPAPAPQPSAPSPAAAVAFDDEEDDEVTVMRSALHDLDADGAPAVRPKPPTEPAKAATARALQRRLDGAKPSPGAYSKQGPSLRGRRAPKDEAPPVRSSKPTRPLGSSAPTHSSRVRRATPETPGAPSSSSLRATPADGQPSPSPSKPRARPAPAKSPSGTGSSRSRSGYNRPRTTTEPQSVVYATPRPDEAAALLSKPDGWPDITEEVADIRFSAIEGFDEATRQQVWKLEAKYPGHPEVAALVAEVAAEDSAKAEVARAEAKAAAAPRAVTPPESAAVPTAVDPADDSLSSLPPASPSPSTPPALLTPVDGPPPLGRYPVSRTETDAPSDLGPAVTGRTAPPVMPTEAVTGRTVVPSEEPPQPTEHRGDSDDTPVGLELPSLVTTPAATEVDENLETSDALLTVDTAGFDELDDDDDEPPTLDPPVAEVPVEAPPALGLRPRTDGPVFEDSLSFGGPLLSKDSQSRELPVGPPAAIAEPAIVESLELGGGVDELPPEEPAAVPGLEFEDEDELDPGVPQFGGAEEPTPESVAAVAEVRDDETEEIDEVEEIEEIDEVEEIEDVEEVEEVEELEELPSYEAELDPADRTMMVRGYQPPAPFAAEPPPPFESSESPADVAPAPAPIPLSDDEEDEDDGQMLQTTLAPPGASRSTLAPLDDDPRHPDELETTLAPGEYTASGLSSPTLAPGDFDSDDGADEPAGESGRYESQARDDSKPGMGMTTPDRDNDSASASGSFRISDLGLEEMPDLEAETSSIRKIDPEVDSQELTVEGTVVARNPLPPSPYGGGEAPVPVLPVRLVMLGSRGEEVTERSIEAGAYLDVGRQPGEPWSNDRRMETLHARLFSAPGGVIVDDFGAPTGVYTQISDMVAVEDGDEFKVGQARLSLQRVVGPDGTWGQLTLVRHDDPSPETYRLDRDAITIGREEGDITLPSDTFVSGDHCRFMREGNAVYLEDRGSSNGTYIRVRAGQCVAYGGLLLVGHTQFKVQQA